MVRFGPNSTGGTYLATSYGPGSPVAEVSGGGGWSIVSPGNRMRRQLNILPTAGPSEGRGTVIDQGVSAPDIGRLRMSEVNGSAGTSPMRWGTALLESMIEHRFVAGLRLLSSTGPTITAGVGSPEGVVSARIGSLYQRTDGDAATSLYVKESGTGNTGWVAK